MKKYPEMLSRMAGDLGAMPSYLNLIITTAPLRYKSFEIPKRDGSARLIAQPAREVKAIQRWIVAELRPHIPIHESVMAYEPGKSIKKNAQAHATNSYFLKMDFSGFFPSIFALDIVEHLKLHCSDIYSDAECHLISRACSWLPTRASRLQLCIGAPSSPLISNSIMHEFDLKIAEICLEKGVRYTRYADDLTFSCNEKGVLSDFPSAVSRFLRELPYPRIEVNQSKTVHTSRAGNRTVTGITITPGGQLSVGRERKRQIRAMYHRSRDGNSTLEEMEKLAGLLAFVDDIEPGFSEKLKAKKSSEPQ